MHSMADRAVGAKRRGADDGRAAACYTERNGIKVMESDSVSAATKLITGEELLAMGDIGPCELIYGRVVHLSMSGWEHGHIAAQLAWLLGEWAGKGQAGFVLGTGTGFLLERNPDLVRAPDAAFVEAQRVAGELPEVFFEGATDLEPIPIGGILPINPANTDVSQEIKDDQAQEAPEDHTTCDRGSRPLADTRRSLGKDRTVAAARQATPVGLP